MSVCREDCKRIDIVLDWKLIMWQRVTFVTPVRVTRVTHVRVTCVTHERVTPVTHVRVTCVGDSLCNTEKEILLCIYLHVYMILFMEINTVHGSALNPPILLDLDCVLFFWITSCKQCYSKYKHTHQSECIFIEIIH